jgi:plastocyanin
MRRFALLAAIGVTGALAVPASASAADVNIGGFAFNPATVTIAMGDTVTWHYMGPDTNHSVTSDAGQAESWDSDPGKLPTAADHPIGTTYQRQFNQAGSFTYHCKVHSYMTGTVNVNGPDGLPPPDTTPPAISGLSAKGGRACGRKARKCKAKATVVRYSLSEDADVSLAFKPRSGKGKTRTFDGPGKSGKNTAKLSVKKLRPGRYKLTVTAVDAAGNAAPPAVKNVTVTLKRR